MDLGLTGEQWAGIGTSLLIVIAAAVLVRILLGYLLDRVFRRALGEPGRAISRTLIKPVRGSLNVLVMLIALDVAILRLDIPFVSEQSASIQNVALATATFRVAA